MGSYGLVTTTFIEKPALAEITRWNDNIKRHTLYTVCDSLQDIWGLYNGARPTVNGPVALKPGSTVPYDAAVGAQASPQLFTWVPVSYPASYLGLPAQLADTWNPRTQSLAQMVVWGATELKAKIESNPGTFALVGTGIGAMVCSAILQEMQTGTLTARSGDCIAAVMFGNGCRQEGVTYPGGIDPGGAGIMPQASTGTKGLIRNVNTPEWWWEMAAVDDPATTCPIDTSGQAINVIAEAVVNASGGRDFMGQLIKVIPTLRRTNAIWHTVAGRLTNRQANTNALAWAERVFAIKPSPHGLYSFAPLPAIPTGLSGLTPTSTYLDAAVAHINLRGTTIPPR